MMSPSLTTFNPLLTTRDNFRLLTNGRDRRLPSEMNLLRADRDESDGPAFSSFPVK